MKTDKSNWEYINGSIMDGKRVVAKDVTARDAGFILNAIDVVEAARKETVVPTHAKIRCECLICQRDSARDEAASLQRELERLKTMVEN